MWIETPWSVSLTVNGGGRSELGKICRRFTLFFQDKLFLMHFFFFFKAEPQWIRREYTLKYLAVGEWLLIRNLNSVFIFWYYLE